MHINRKDYVENATIKQKQHFLDGHGAIGYVKMKI